MGKHQHYYESDQELRSAFEKSIDSGNLSTKFDEDSMHSVDDLYDAWKFDTFRYSKDDLEWSDSDGDDIDDDDDED